MSRSGVRMFTMVAVVGVGLVGALSVVGLRVSQRGRRPQPAPSSVAAENGEAPAPVVRVRTDYDQPAPTGESAGQRAGEGAMLPRIAAEVAREGSREAVGAAGGEQRRYRHGDPSLEGYREPDRRQRVLRQQLESVLAHHPSVELAFVNCDQPDCRARAEARDLASLKSFIKDASALASSMKMHVETHTSAFNGTSYRVDLEGPPPPASAAAVAPTPGG